MLHVDHIIVQAAHWSIFVCGLKAILIGSDVSLTNLVRRRK